MKGRKYDNREIKVAFIEEDIYRTLIADNDKRQEKEPAENKSISKE